MNVVCSVSCVLSLILLSACDKGPVQPEKIDVAVAAQTWNTPAKTWSESDLYRLEEGRRLYQGNCAACHQSSGEGQQSFGAPALKGSGIVKGPADALITLVLDGRNSMPSFRRAVDAPNLAAILSYVRNAWGNDTGEVIDTAMVAALTNPADVQGQGDETISDQ